jgi:hypothetical protein
MKMIYGSVAAVALVFAVLAADRGLGIVALLAVGITVWCLWRLETPPPTPSREPVVADPPGGTSNPEH